MLKTEFGTWNNSTCDFGMTEKKNTVVDGARESLIGNPKKRRARVTATHEEGTETQSTQLCLNISASRQGSSVPSQMSGFGRFVGSSHRGGGGGLASTNWQYFTEEDRLGPCKEEMIMSTTRAKLHFELATSDLERIQSYQRQGARSTLTMYYVNDLRDGAIAKHGQDHFDNRVAEGKELLGVVARERAEKEEKDCLAAQAGRSGGTSDSTGCKRSWSAARVGRSHCSTAPRRCASSAF